MLFSFWTGPLTWVERLCMTSMLRNGHSLTVYSFGPLDVPSGVIVRDAANVLPKEKFTAYPNGSPALFTNLFRYQGLRNNLGTWIDLDVLVLRNLNGLGDYIFGIQDEKGWINGAVFRLPSDSPVLQDLLDCCNGHVIVAPYWSRWRKLRQRGAALFGFHKRLEELSWGTIGPKLITHCVRKHGLKPLPKSVLYPYGPNEAEIAFDPSVCVEDLFAEGTYAVHLWNEKIKALKLRPPPSGSFLSRMCEKYGIESARQAA